MKITNNVYLSLNISTYRQKRFKSICGTMKNYHQFVLFLKIHKNQNFPHHPYHSYITIPNKFNPRLLGVRYFAFQPTLRSGYP